MTRRLPDLMDHLVLSDWRNKKLEIRLDGRLPHGCWWLWFGERQLEAVSEHDHGHGQHFVGLIFWPDNSPWAKIYGLLRLSWPRPY